MMRKEVDHFLWSANFFERIIGDMMKRMNVVLLVFIMALVGIVGCDAGTELSSDYVLRKDNCLKSKSEGVDKVEYDSKNDICLCTFSDINDPLIHTTVECFNGTVCDAEMKGCRKGCKVGDILSCKDGIAMYCDFNSVLTPKQCVDGACNEDGTDCAIGMMEKRECDGDKLYISRFNEKTRQYEVDREHDYVDCAAVSGKCENNAMCTCTREDRCLDEDWILGEKGDRITCNYAGGISQNSVEHCADGWTCPKGGYVCEPEDGIKECEKNTVRCVNHELERCVDGYHYEKDSIIHCEKGCVSILGNITCRECNPGERKCNEAGDSVTCWETGRWSVNPQECPNGCKDGECVTP